jgi:thioredoxin reductase (NADPH)
MSQYLIEQLRRKPNIAVRLGAEVTAAHGEAHLTEIDIRDVGAGSQLRTASDGVFVFIGADADTDWLPAEVALDARGYVLTGVEVAKAGRWSQSRDPYLLETSIPGVFACGDVRLSPVKRVAAAVGEGSMAIAFVHQFLSQAARG